MTEDANDHDEARDAPQLDEALEGKSIAFDAAEAGCKQADDDADDRDEIVVAWDEVIESPIQALSFDSFEDRKGETFQVDLGHHVDEIELVEITKLGDAIDVGSGGEKRVPFEVVFKDLTTRTRLPEGIYRLRNEGLGEIELYLAPEGANHNRLVATFC